MKKAYKGIRIGWQRCQELPPLPGDNGGQQSPIEGNATDTCHNQQGDASCNQHADAETLYGSAAMVWIPGSSSHSTRVEDTSTDTLLAAVLLRA